MSSTGKSSINDYVARRYKSPETTEKGEICIPHSIATLPLEDQCIYRRKLLSLLAVQIAFVGSIVCLATFQPDANKYTVDFVEENYGFVILAFMAAVCMLGLLYIVRNIYILNAIIFLCFSICQAVFGITWQTVLDSNIGVFNCGFTLFCLIIMIMLSQTFTKRKEKPAETDGIEVITENREKLERQFTFNSIAASLIAFGIMAVVATGVYVTWLMKDEIITSTGFVYTILCQGFLMIWFAWNTSVIYKILTPKEYKHGLIYAYVDLVIIISLIAVASAISIAGVALSVCCCGDGCDCDCGCCSFCNELTCCDGYDCCDCTNCGMFCDSGDCASCCRDVSHCSECACCILNSNEATQQIQNPLDNHIIVDILPAYTDQV